MSAGRAKNSVGRGGGCIATPLWITNALGIPHAAEIDALSARSYATPTPISAA